MRRVNYSEVVKTLEAARAVFQGEAKKNILSAIAIVKQRRRIEVLRQRAHNAARGKRRSPPCLMKS